MDGITKITLTQDGVKEAIRLYLERAFGTSIHPDQITEVDHIFGATEICFQKLPEGVKSPGILEEIHRRAQGDHV